MPIPTLISKLEGIVKVKCGTNHCLALNKNGEVFSWGSGKTGELGNGIE